MIKIEKGCVDCGLPCLGTTCRYYRMEVHYCDECGEELDYDRIYSVQDEEYCYKCYSQKYEDEEEEE